MAMCHGAAGKGIRVPKGHGLGRETAGGVTERVWSLVAHVSEAPPMGVGKEWRVVT